MYSENMIVDKSSPDFLFEIGRGEKEHIIFLIQTGEQERRMNKRSRKIINIKFL